METPDKNAVVAALRAQVEQELAAAIARAQDAAEGATHVEARAEGSKDTRATEASYLARGQTARVKELDYEFAVLQGLKLAPFAEGAAIDVGAMIELDRQGQRSWSLLLTVAGGRKVELDGVTVTAISVTSPLGEALVGYCEGEDVQLAVGGAAPRTWSVLAVR